MLTLRPLSLNPLSPYSFPNSNALPKKSSILEPNILSSHTLPEPKSLEELREFLEKNINEDIILNVLIRLQANLLEKNSSWSVDSLINQHRKNITPIFSFFFEDNLHYISQVVRSHSIRVDILHLHNIFLDANNLNSLRDMCGMCSNVILEKCVIGNNQLENFCKWKLLSTIQTLSTLFLNSYPRDEFLMFLRNKTPKHVCF